jgi:RNA polymerase sigma-70 factor, ECF subfamily
VTSATASISVFSRRTAQAGARPDAFDESVLVERVQAGDVAAYDELVNRHMRRAFSVAYRLLGHREDAEDLVQDAFLTALEKIDTFQPGRGFGPWFYRILVNRGLNTRKARSIRRTEELPDELTASGPLPDRAAERSELRERLDTALAGLPEKQRAAVQLFELEGFSGAEIAEILEIPAGTVRYHLHQARQTLRDALQIFHRKEA